MKWLSGLDVNAVFAAILAAIAYWHNHNFRVRKETGTLTPPTTPAAGASLVTVVLCCAGAFALLALAPLGCGASTSKRDTYAAAVAVCTPATLATLGAKLAAVEQQHDTMQTATLGIELVFEEALCIRATVGAAAALQGSGKE